MTPAEIVALSALATEACARDDVPTLANGVAALVAALAEATARAERAEAIAAAESALRVSTIRAFRLAYRVTRARDDEEKLAARGAWEAESRLAGAAVDKLRALGVEP